MPARNTVATVASFRRRLSVSPASGHPQSMGRRLPRDRPIIRHGSRLLRVISLSASQASLQGSKKQHRSGGD